MTLTGHTYRVLYLAGSPDGQTIVTGAGDETLRFWNVFPPNNGNDNNGNSSLTSHSYSGGFGSPLSSNTFDHTQANKKSNSNAKAYLSSTFQIR